jgi:hypothetical protein
VNRFMQCLVVATIARFTDGNKSTKSVIQLYIGDHCDPHFHFKEKEMDDSALNVIDGIVEKNNSMNTINSLLNQLYDIVQLIQEDFELTDEDIVIKDDGIMYITYENKTWPIDDFFSNRVIHSSRMSKYNRGIVHGYESCLAVVEEWFGKKSKVYKSLKKEFAETIKSDYDIDV